MTARRKDPSCQDTVNSLTHQDKVFHFSVAYQWFHILTLEHKKNNQIWMTRLVNVGCIPEVFDFMELVSWCA